MGFFYFYYRKILDFFKRLLEEYKKKKKSYFIQKLCILRSHVCVTFVSLCSFQASFAESDRGSRAQSSKACDIFLSRLRKKSAHLIFCCLGSHLLLTLIRRVDVTSIFFFNSSYCTWFCSLYNSYLAFLAKKGLFLCSVYNYFK